MTQRQAEEHFQIPRSTIKNKLIAAHAKSAGRPKVFTDAEEECFTAHILELSDHAFPIDETDFRMFVKQYLDSQGRTEKRFKNNIPGKYSSQMLTHVFRCGV